MKTKTAEEILIELNLTYQSDDKLWIQDEVINEFGVEKIINAMEEYAQQFHFPSKERISNLICTFRNDILVEVQKGVVTNNFTEKWIESHFAELSIKAESGLINTTINKNNLEKIKTASESGEGEEEWRHTLNCDKCYEPFESKDAFPNPQLCDKCKSPAKQDDKAIIEKMEELINHLSPFSDCEVCQELLAEIASLQIQIPDKISDEQIEKLPCREFGCQNPHERIYRGCDKCKFKKVDR